MTDDPKMDETTEMLVGLAEGLTPMFEGASGIIAKAKSIGLTDEQAGQIGMEFIVMCFRKTP